MRLRCPTNPAAADLRAWAADAEAPEPMPDWDLVLSWGMEPGRLRACVELAAAPDCHKRGFFLLALYRWVEVAVRGDHFESRRELYDAWLDAARGVADPAVKRWRRRARLVFQGVEMFSKEGWWANWQQESAHPAAPG